MSCSRTHAFGTNASASAMSPAVLPSGSGSRIWIASIRRQGLSAAAGLSPVVVVIVTVFFCYGCCCRNFGRAYETSYPVFISSLVVRGFVGLVRDAACC